MDMALTFCDECGRWVNTLQFWKCSLTCFSFIEVLYQFGSETFRAWIFHEVFISVWWRIFIWLIFFLRGFLCTNIVIVILPYNCLSLYSLSNVFLLFYWRCGSLSWVIFWYKPQSLLHVRPSTMNIFYFNRLS